MQTHATALHIHPNDNVVVAISPVLVPGTVVNYGVSSLIARASVATGHKLALVPIASGDLVVKYGQSIGVATSDIAVGDFVHTHNVATTLNANDLYTYSALFETQTALPNMQVDLPNAQSASPAAHTVSPAPHTTTPTAWGGPRARWGGPLASWDEQIGVQGSRNVDWGGRDVGRGRHNVDWGEENGVCSSMSGRLGTFDGYVRADGRVGIRNEVWILCTVGCINRLSEHVAALAHAELGPNGQKLVDGVFAFTHPYGCAQIGDDLLQTRRAIASLAAHPNCGGVLLMGLGCENNVIQEQVAALRASEAGRLRVFSAQDVENEVEYAVEEIRKLVEACASDKREPVCASKLLLGMKCGGSDGFSGLTANPLLGKIADAHAQNGGKSILTEVPEMFGAEKLLMARSLNRDVFDKQVHLINNFKNYFRKYREPISENPAPGNKAGGITTLEEKSLGCIQKGGANCPVVGVLDYGEAYNSPDAATPGGILLADGPGNDAVSCTTLAMAGAQMVLFTTGRGTPFGTCVPTLKIATNSSLATRKPHWIDHNAGDLLETGDKNASADTLWVKILSVASGKEPTRNELNGYREIAIWKDGVTT